jgi:hypothetical protein
MVLTRFNSKYKNHLLSIELNGTRSETRDYIFDRVQLFVDGVLISPILGTSYEPKSFAGNQEQIRDAAKAYAEEAAKRIIDHLVEEK